MKVVGLFRELGIEIDQSTQSIHDVAGALSSDKVDAVVRYLNSGVPVFDVMGATSDPFDRSIQIPGGPSLVTDGVWIWRYDLAYFVQRYLVGLPDEFVSFAISNETVKERPELLCERWREVVDEYERAARPASV
jgi:hypothetical protein